ncbi:MAG: hypothetical protein CMP25_02575 [Rickettsiales bacterium]|nr:hypothetical protein [Rickettsiales bacterium]|tara:strand:+ start:608 stop:1039 length:432 start_codon:yes stop_codon:yes gene_type:complete
MIIENSIVTNIFYCLVIQLITLVLSIEISKLFNIKIMEFKIINFYERSKFIKIVSYTIFIITYLIASFIFLSIKGVLGLELLNLVFFLIIIFELFIKIGNSRRFIGWLGDGLDKTLRSFMMFIISLNVIYFLTRITHSILLIK